MNLNKIIKSKKLRFKILSAFYWIPDKIWLKILYRIKNGYWMNFKNPKTFNEKLQWLKIYDNKPEYTKMVDKYAVKEYVANIIGSKYIIPTLGVWNSPKDIEWDKLPKKFVLKTTHGSGSSGVVICQDKDSFDRENAIKTLQDSMDFNCGYAYREKPYIRVERKVIAEEFIENAESSDELADYKIFCFNGKPLYIQVIQNRHTEETIDFFDTEWNHQEFYGLNPVAKPATDPVAKPVYLEEMLQIAKKLSIGKPFERVDLYHTSNGVYFGEITFYPASGFGTFTPEEYNLSLGNLINLQYTHPKENYKSLMEGEGGGNYLKLNLLKTECQNKEIKDYKFFCFNGNPEFLKVDFGRFSDHHANYYDMHWNLLPFGEVEIPPVESHIELCPNGFEQMINIAKKLSKGIPFVRIDLYNVNDRIYFGEITFYPASGLAKWTDSKYDIEIGNLLKI